jgi:hypothetical protein
MRDASRRMYVYVGERPTLAALLRAAGLVFFTLFFLIRLAI